MANPFERLLARLWRVRLEKLGFQWVLAFGFLDTLSVDRRNAASHFAGLHARYIYHVDLSLEVCYMKPCPVAWSQGVCNNHLYNYIYIYTLTYTDVLYVCIYI